MLFSRLPVRCGQAFLLLLAAQLYACGSGGQSARVLTPVNDVDDQTGNIDISVSNPVSYQLGLEVSEGGYVLDNTVNLLCSGEFPLCDTEVDANAIKTLRATSRFGYEFTGWNGETSRNQTLDLVVSQDTQIAASFTPITSADASATHYKSRSCNSNSSSELRALHLGDSLTAGFIFGGEHTLLAPEMAAIEYYEQSASARIEPPTVVAMWNILIAGRNDGTQGQILPENHIWKQELTKRQAAIDDFNTVVVALGSNDAVQIINGLDPDFVIEQRVKPLLRWLGDKPVFWILPHYGRWPTAMQNVTFSGKSDGLDCSCDGTPVHSSTQCHIIDEMQICSVEQDLQQQTITAFRAIHALRERLAALQAEYPNLIVVDPIETVAAASGNQYDFYATMSPDADTIHFSVQGTEWYAWLHAWLALHADTSCSLPALQKWQMGSAEIAMAAQLDFAL